MSSKAELMSPGDVLNMSPIEITPLGSDGPALNPGLVIRSEIVNWGEVTAQDSNDDCDDDYSRPINTCFEICG